MSHFTRLKFKAIETSIREATATELKLHVQEHAAYSNTYTGEIVNDVTIYSRGSESIGVAADGTIITDQMISQRLASDFIQTYARHALVGAAMEEGGSVESIQNQNGECVVTINF